MPFWSKRHGIELFDKVVESVIGDVFGFLALGLVLSLLLREHIGEILERGLKFIGTVLAQAFRDELAAPLVQQATTVSDGIEKFIFAHSVPGVKQEDTDISALLKVELAKIDDLAKRGKLEQAFQELVALRKKYPKELEVLRKLIEISERGDAKAVSRRAALDVVKSAQGDFAKDPEYFTLLAMCYVSSREDGPRASMYREALAAAKKAAELETDADKVPRRLAVVGIVHFYFSDVEKAIELCEQALAKLEGVSTKTGMDSSARVKNNLAFFIAERSTLTDKPRAMAMAESVVKYDEETHADDYLPASWDTLGYVLFRFAETREEIEQALGYFQKALVLAPDDVDYNKHKISAQIALAA